MGLALFCPGLLSLKLPNSRWCRKSHPSIHRESARKPLQYANGFLRMCSAPNPDYVSISRHQVNDIRHRPAITECQVQQEHERLLTWETSERGPCVVNRKGTIQDLVSSFRSPFSPSTVPADLSPEERSELEEIRRRKGALLLEIQRLKEELREAIIEVEGLETSTEGRSGSHLHASASSDVFFPSNLPSLVDNSAVIDMYLNSVCSGGSLDTQSEVT